VCPYNYTTNFVISQKPDGMNPRPIQQEADLTPAPIRTFRRSGRSLPPARIRTLDRSDRRLVTALHYPGSIMLLPNFICLREEAKFIFLNSVGLSTLVSLHVVLWMQRLRLNSMRTGTISKVHTLIRYSIYRQYPMHDAISDACRGTVQF